MFGASGTIDIKTVFSQALPPREFARIPGTTRTCLLDKGKLVYLSGDRIRYVYFPVKGLLSLISPQTETGATVEVAKSETKA
jgi:hypothetical protein